jgi:hypothetical protein
MTCALSIAIVAAFLFGTVIVLLAIIVSGIHADDRARNLTGAPRTRTAAVTRRLLGVGVRGTGSEDHDDRL